MDNAVSIRQTKDLMISNFYYSLYDGSNEIFNKIKCKVIKKKCISLFNSLRRVYVKTRTAAAISMALDRESSARSSFSKARASFSSKTTHPEQLELAVSYEAVFAEWNTKELL